MSPHSRILIVDDHPSNVEILTELLEDDNQLATAASGEEALALAPDFAPDLILLDIMMPGIDGYDTCRQLRTHSKLGATKIIMVSAKAMPSERLQGYQAGADDYITKPFNKEELRAKVRVYLRLKSVEEVDQLKTDLLALLCDATCTPLHGILHPLRKLSAQHDLSADDRTLFVGMIEHSITHLQSLFETILTLHAMKDGQWTFQGIPGDLDAIVGGGLEDETAPASTQNPTANSTPPEATPAKLEAQKMIRVVTALLEQASPGAGQASVEVWRDEAHVCVKLSHQGDGIDPVRVQQAFEALGHTDGTPPSSGSDLPLTLARQIVQSHQGTIEVEDTPDRGPTFMVRLPVAHA